MSENFHYKGFQFPWLIYALVVCVTLLNIVINSKNLIDSLEPLMYNISSAKGDAPSYPSGIPSLYYSKSSTTVWNRSGRKMVGRTLVPDALSFSLFSIMLAINMLYIVFIILRYAPTLSYLAFS